jgi:hypothetical protein
MMALSHHLIIQFAAHLIKERDPVYCVLGDDALIIGTPLFDSYKKVCDSLAIEINLSKTFFSHRLSEFAKRFFYDGVEISPFPIGAVMSSKGNVPLLSVALSNALAKD